MNNFFEELKRRNVYKVAVAYLVTAWLIIQVVNTVGPNLNWPDTVPSLVTRILLVGFPIALVLAWLYELTPEGFKRTGMVQTDTSDNRKVGRRLNRVIIGSLSLVLILMLVERMFLAGSTLYDDKQHASIAVLPFANMSSEEENEYFADGLAEEILDELAQISGMQVLARTSSFKFKDRNEDVRKIGEQLAVNYVLEGSVRYDQQNNRIRITTQLINTSNGYHLWSNTYDEDFEQIFDIQEDVSRKVARELQVRLLPYEDSALAGRKTEDTDAYKLYVKARTYSVKREDADLQKAIDLLEKAIELDSDFAEAYAELSFLYGQRFFFGNLPKSERDEKMKYYLDKALALAPQKAEVLWAKSAARMRKWVAKDSSEVIQDLQKAIELKPSYADAYSMLSYALNRARQPKSALKALERAVELDPYNPWFKTDLANNYYYRLGKKEEGMAMLDEVIREDSFKIAAVAKAGMLTNGPYGEIGQAFILYHRVSKNDPYERPNPLLVFSWDLDIPPVSDKYAQYQQLSYPDNEHHTFWNILATHFLNKDYRKAKEWVLYWQQEKNLDQKDVEENLALIEEYKGNHQPLVSFYKKFHPEFDNEDFSASQLDHGIASYLISYIDVLRRDRKILEADRLTDILCEFYEETVKNDPVAANSFKQRYLLDCLYYSNDTTEFVNLLQKRYFKTKDRDGIYRDLKLDTYSLFNGNKDYQDLVNRIRNEVHRQRTEVIAYLKEEGEWDPAWDKEIGLDE